MRAPRGLVVAIAAATALVWGLYALDPSAWPGLTGATAQTALLLTNLVVTTRSPRTKILIVRAIQRHVVNPLVRLLFRVGINPLGLAILETRGRVSGRPRRTPVGNGRVGDEFWIIAEHGRQAGYVRNIEHDPRVRIRLRVGWRYRWIPGVAEIRPHDDALARQRAMIRWHPLRILNAMSVRVLGADLLVVRVRLHPDDGSRPGATPVLPDHRAASHGNSLGRPVGDGAGLGVTFLNLEDESGMPVVTCSEGLSARYRPVALSSSALLGSPEGVLDLAADLLQESLSYRDGEPVRGITSRQRQPSEATGPAGWSRPGASRS